MRMIIGLCLALALSSPADACRFILLPVDENIRRAEAVFVGTVERTKDGFRSGQGGVAWMKVLAFHKGPPVGQIVEVRSNVGSCSYDFSRGEQWLVLAKRTGPSTFDTDMPSGSLLLTDSRGLYQRENWQAVKDRFSAQHLNPLLKTNACVDARFALMDFFSRLPRTCNDDTGCVADQYIDSHPCYAPVITNLSRVPAPDMSELVGLQKAERAACHLDEQRIPACSPGVVFTECRERRCVQKIR
jgi:hypothetical protein